MMTREEYRHMEWLSEKNTSSAKSWCCMMKCLWGYYVGMWVRLLWTVSFRYVETRRTLYLDTTTLSV